MVGMGYRTIKTAIGAGLAIWIASKLDLEFATFSGIIVILCMEKTKKKTLISMKEKFLASLLSMALGALFFEVIGYHPIVFTLFILLFVPLLVRLKIHAGFVTSMVVVLHVYTVGNASISMFLNELYIIFIGMGIALLVNSFMPSFKEDLEKYKKEIEINFEKILYEYSAYLRDSERKWNGNELFEVEDLINQAKSVVILDIENHFLRKENTDYYYLEMRENQLELLKQMLKVIAVISTTKLNIPQKEMFAEFLEDLSGNVRSGNPKTISLGELDQLKESMEQTKLPETREEFEVRANLFYLIFEMENYLKIKKKLYTK